jgi:hypothetical protein
MQRISCPKCKKAKKFGWNRAGIVHVLLLPPKTIEFWIRRPSMEIWVVVEGNFCIAAAFRFPLLVEFEDIWNWKCAVVIFGMQMELERIFGNWMLWNLTIKIWGIGARWKKVKNWNKISNKVFFRIFFCKYRFLGDNLQDDAKNVYTFWKKNSDKLYKLTQK